MTAVEMLGFMDDPKDYLDFSRWQIACIMSNLEDEKKHFPTLRGEEVLENNLKIYGKIYEALEEMENNIREGEKNS